METTPAGHPALMGYGPSVQRHDEVCSSSGEPRPHWRHLMAALATLGPGELEERRREINRLLRDNGVTYSAYGDSDNHRHWQLDPVPFTVASDEWRTIERGLSQRAELLNLVVQDLYGPRELLRKGLLPPELIFAHPGFLRACDGLENSTPRSLTLYAADLARGVDGGFHVIGDRSQMLPGVGYALENRLVLSRVWPSLFRDSHVHRLALFFRTLRTTLQGAAWRRSDDTRIVLFSPGPSSPHYFEHAFLANYLGYTLVEGADLLLRDGRIWLKTLDGLRPVDVLLRYVDDWDCDPLELRPDSPLGVAGLLRALRTKQVAVVNPLGCGVLDNPALMAFLPALAQHFFGHTLQLPSPVTYWCGLAKHRDHVLAHLGELVIRPTTRGAKSQAILGRSLDHQARAALTAAIQAQPHRFVAQEEVVRSTAPLFAHETLTPKPITLRTFLVASGDSYAVMPGGLTRVSTGLTAGIFDSPISKDTWVMASEPERQLTLLPPPRLQALFVDDQGELPSRVAENLYWLGRYAERAEGISRLLRAVTFHRLALEDRELDAPGGCLATLLMALTTLTATQPGFVGEGAEQRLAQPEEELLAVFLDTRRPGSLAAVLQALMYAARSVRDRISPDIWRVFTAIDDRLSRLRLQWRAKQPHPTANDTLEELDALLTSFAAFTGLAVDNMVHGQGWRFLTLGRRLERARQSAHLLEACLATVSADEASLLEQLLKIFDSLMTYRSRYRTQVQTQGLLELLLQDEANPRSTGYQLRRIQGEIQHLPGHDTRGSKTFKAPEQRLALEILTRLRLASSEELVRVEGGERRQLRALLEHLGRQLPALSDALTNSYFSHADQPQPLVRFERELPLPLEDTSQQP